jgi:16S rRNA (guanine527-N7)-methyltransferase
MLKESLLELRTPLPDDMSESLSRFLDLLMSWNARINLVSRKLLREELQALALTSLAPLTLNLGEVVDMMDVGSGGGFPALPLLLARPDWRGVLVEATGKKCLFLREALETLAPGRGEVVNERIENVDFGGRRFRVVTIRGVRVEPKLAARIGELLTPDGCLIYYSGADEDVQAEVANKLRSGGFEQVRPVPVDSVRTHLLIATK